MTVAEHFSSVFFIVTELNEQKVINLQRNQMKSETFRLSIRWLIIQFPFRKNADLRFSLSSMAVLLNPLHICSFCIVLRVVLIFQWKRLKNKLFRVTFFSLVSSYFHSIPLLQDYWIKNANVFNDDI